MDIKRVAFMVIGLTLWCVSQNGLALTEVHNLLARKAAILSTLHKKAKKALVNAAQDKAYKAFLHAHGEGQVSPHLRDKVDQISLQVQSNFHVEEMCLIHPDGAELSRIVGNQIAYDLSQDETGANFFRPGFEGRVHSVYVSQLYLSPDANKWVLAYVTPVVVNGEKKAILHYEHGLDIYQNALNRELDGNERFLIAVNPSGWVVSDSRAEIAVTKHKGNEDPAHYFEQFRFGGQSLAEVLRTIDAQGTVDDEQGKTYDAAYQRLEHWTLIAFQRR